MARYSRCSSVLIRTLLLTVRLVLSANGVDLLPYGPSVTSDVALPRGDDVYSPYLTCTVPPLFLGDKVYNWTVGNLGYIYTYDG